MHSLTICIFPFASPPLVSLDSRLAPQPQKVQNTHRKKLQKKITNRSQSKSNEEQQILVEKVMENI